MGTWVCHCRACTRSKGGGPAWLVAVAGEAIEYTKGADLVKTIEAPDAYGTMTHTFCTNCGSHIYQNPQKAHAGARRTAPNEVPLTPLPTPCPAGLCWQADEGVLRERLRV